MYKEVQFRKCLNNKKSW